jgi:hypothetical protein
MDEWGVEMFFTMSMCLHSRASAELCGRRFVGANFADSSSYRNYPGRKRTQILGVGSHANHYPWRYRVNHLLVERFAVDALPRQLAAMSSEDDRDVASRSRLQHLLCERA